MKQYFDLIYQSSLFKGFNQLDVQTALNCLKGQVVLYQTKEIILYAESPLNSIGIILEGSVHLNKNNIHGEKKVFSLLTAGDLFGENCLWGQDINSSFEVEATSPCTILYIERQKILNPQTTTCHLRQRIIENLFKLLLINNQTLYQKIEMTSQKNTREQLLYYLQLQAQKNNSSTFNITFSRQELADYLGVDRSALSRELSKMKTEKLIDYKRNNFQLL